jgi:hypothetical protein
MEMSGLVQNAGHELAQFASQQRMEENALKICPCKL